MIGSVILFSSECGDLGHTSACVLSVHLLSQKKLSSLMLEGKKDDVLPSVAEGRFLS